ncbi:MAG: glycosyltransferase family 4 protein [Pseudomonadota bacterium]
MKIVHFHFADPHGVGGTESVIATLAGLQVEQGHDVRLLGIGPRFQDWRQEGLITTGVANLPTALVPGSQWPNFGSPRSWLSAAKSCWSLYKVLSAWGPEVIHVHLPVGQALYLSLIQPVLRLRYRTQIVVTLHGPDINLSPGVEPRMVPWQRRLLQRADRVVAVSQSLRDQAYDLHPTLMRDIHVVHNGISDEWFISRSEASDGGKSVLYVGRISHEKGIDTLLEAWARVMKHIPDARLQLFGSGPQQNAVSHEIAEGGLHQSATLHPAIDAAGVRELMRAATVLVLPSRTEAFPMVLLEAAAMGLPAIASNVGGVAEIIDDGATGSLVDAGDSESLALALIQHLSISPIEQAEIGAAARAKAENHFRAAVMAESYQRAYGVKRQSLHNASQSENSGRLQISHHT